MRSEDRFRVLIPPYYLIRNPEGKTAKNGSTISAPKKKPENSGDVSSGLILRQYTVQEIESPETCHIFRNQVKILQVVCIQAPECEQFVP